jgi:hypothetical protein
MGKIVQGSAIGTGQKVRVRRNGSRDEVGIDTLVETYRCNFADLYDLMPERDEPYPTNPALLAKGVPSWVTLGGDLVEYTVTYSGYSAGAGSVSTAKPVYRLGKIERTEPLNNHPNFEVNATGYPESIKTAIGTVAYNSSFENGRFISIANAAATLGSTDGKLIVGQDSFMDMGVVWQEEKIESGPPSLAKVLRIYTTGELPGPVLNFGTPDEARNWLETVPEAEQEGTVWRVRRNWILSGRNGWSKLTYKLKSAA